jgi:hypothetical protein
MCLRCRHDQFQATQRRRQQMLMQFLGLASIAGIIAVAGVAGAITLRGGDAANVTETSAGNVALNQAGKAKTRMPRPLSPTPVRASTTVAPAEPVEKPAPATPAAPAPVAATPPPAATARPAGNSSLGQGRTTLTDSIYAMRSGDSVVVNFDTKGNRTGRADKFEQMVRATLPLVYGRRNTASIDSVPAGSLLPSRDVLGELASRGMHLQLDNGLKIALWPQTRETTSGPLVVAYLLLVER